jgi:hypothetical protein
MQTTRGISAAIASSIPAAASGGLWLVRRLEALVRPSNLRDKDSRGVCSSLFHGVCNILEDRPIQMHFSGLLWICSSNDLGAFALSGISSSVVEPNGLTIFDSLSSMETAVQGQIYPNQSTMATTHVPCLPVKPWKITLVLLFILRFFAVSEYAEETEA